MERGSIKFRLNSDNILSVKIELADSTVWLTKNEIARLLDVFVQSVSTNLREIFKYQELFEGEVTKPSNGVIYYNLDVVIALAFRCKSSICRKFREWLRDRAKQTITANHLQPIFIQLSSKSPIA